MTALPELPALRPALALVREGLTEQAQQALDTDPSELVRRWVAGLAEGSRKSYRRGVRDFGRWALGREAEPEDVLRLLAATGAAGAHNLVLGWREAMEARGLAPATVAGQLSTIASLVRQLRRSGAIAWSIEAVSPKIERVQDRRGPSHGEVERLLAHVDAIAEAGQVRAKRDAAILRLLHNSAFRRAEVVGLRWPQDLELDGADGPCAWVLRKGLRQRVRLLIDEHSARCIRAWLAVRGTEPGPLFISTRSPAGAPIAGALSGEAVRQMLRSRAKQAGIRAPCRPHGLRHSAATEAARRGSLAELRSLGGWKSLSAAAAYLDEQQSERRRALGLVAL